MQSVEPYFAPLVDETRGRKPLGEKAMTNAERQAKHRVRNSANKPRREIRGANGTERKRFHRQRKHAIRLQNIAVLDMETDPFDSDKRASVYPFVACLYSDNFEPVIIWEENYERLADKVVAAIMALPEPYTIYAHNGGKFDYLYIIHLIRGAVSFKGRGIMSARIGPHELRDSFHIIPEKLANFQKELFDYQKNTKERRRNYRDEIISYLLSDCRYLLDIVKTFLTQFGFRLSVGQAAMAEIRKHYHVEKFSHGFDGYIRDFYFGGRVECIRGAGHFKGDYKLVDTNSMYPFVMANYAHPIGGFHDYHIRSGDPDERTAFMRISCRNLGALVARIDTGTSTRVVRGTFYTTAHEYRTAIKYGLIDDVEIEACIQCEKWTTFDKFVLPLYANRLTTKQTLADLKARGLEGTRAYIECKKDDIFYKLLLNNGYGKFAQNPAKYKDHYITDPGEYPEPQWLESIYEMGDLGHEYLQPHFESDKYWIWVKPSPGFRYNNVGTAASITGAARAVLLEALQFCERPIYCDTDSIICEGWDERQLKIHPTELGAWDLEREFSEVIVDGKKLYAARDKSGKEVIKSKGTAGLDWRDMLDILDDKVIVMRNRAPTLTMRGSQHYIERSIKRTAERAA